jgi:SPP1 family predicted phage head-tail adaptor
MREGGFSQIWQVKYQCWAKMESLFNRRLIGSEVALAKRVVSSNFYQFTIRYKPDLNQNMRIRYNNQVFAIIKIIDSFNRKNFLRIVAEEILEPITIGS